jgi:GTP pyrophosphokinase
MRAEGMDAVPPADEANQALWDEVLRMAGSRSRTDLMVDIGMGGASHRWWLRA